MPEKASGRLTQEEIDERNEWLRKRQEERDNDPDFIKRREWIKEAFGHDLDAIAGFAARLMETGGDLEKENETLVHKLNQIYSVAHGLSLETEIPAHVKRNIATLSVEHDPKDPTALAFLSGMKVSKQLQARAGATKRHATNASARKFVETEWALHQTAYKNNKSAFARDYVRRLKNEFEVAITEKQMREVWLRDTADPPPARIPDG